MNPKYLSTNQYAQLKGISRMQVTRLIKSGQLSAQRIGKNWMILSDQTSTNQIDLEKTTSLQKWAKIIKEKLHKNIDIEATKDRETIYSRLNGLGLPVERCLAFSLGKFPAKHDFDITVGRLGYPYWISAVPDPKIIALNRLSKLRLYDLASGWDFINDLPQKESYKIIVSQYPDNPEFKGTTLISPKGFGIAEFITGDRHYIMTRGFTLTDPMLFDQHQILRFSKTISPSKQKKLYHLVRGIYGHLEFQYGQLDHKSSLTFFDYNDETAYIEIDHVWDDLVKYFSLPHRKQPKFIYGLPASCGQAEGKCVVIHHESPNMFVKIEKGDILVSDTTTPDMTPYMEKVSAIVTDLGGVTSHAAIVCRELKIPAIVGVGNATERLRDGDYVRLNADQGQIEILKLFSS